MLESWQFHTGKFQDVEYLIAETDALFKTKIVPLGGKDQFGSAVDRILDHRRWRRSEPLIGSRLEERLRSFGIFYVPKQLQPGPCFCFPSTDATGRRTRARISPFGWELKLKNGVAKYAVLGLKHTFVGPLWLGDSDEAVHRIIETGKCCVVEGPFDMLAASLVSDMPVLTTGTKTLNEQHWAWLRVLGVRDLTLMFDNDPEQGQKLGAGAEAMHRMCWTAKAWKIRASEAICPAKDPSACLESPATTIQLKRMLNQAFEESNPVLLNTRLSI